MYSANCYFKHIRTVNLILFYFRFYDKKMSVVGLDGVKQSLEQFLSEQGIESSVQKVPSLGDQAEVFIVSTYSWIEQSIKYF